MEINHLFNLTGKVAIVTGGTRGIGEKVAQGLKAAGARVWIHGTKKDVVQEVAEKNGFSYGYGNLSKAEDVKRFIEEIKAKEEVVDILVNNAGVEWHQQIENADENFLDDIYAVNVKAPYSLTQGLLPLIKKAEGASIINVTSIHDIVPVRENSSYCMSKASLGMMTKVAALELAKYGIRVNNLAPGAIATDHNRDLIQTMDFDKWIPMERVGEAEEMIGPIIFLASNASSYMTGATLYVDGGYKENLLRY